MYDHVSFASKVLRTLTAKAPFSSPEPVVLFGHEALVRYKLGRVDLWTRIPKPVKARNWTKYRKFSIKPPRMQLDAY